MKNRSFPTQFTKRYKFRLSHFINQIFYVRHMAELHNFIEGEIDRALEGAYVCPFIDKKGRCRINLSMGEDKAFSGWVAWKDFAEMFWENGDVNDMKKYIPLLEALVRKLRKEIKLRE